MIKKYEGKKVSLAPIIEDCAELWTEWLNDPEVAIPLGDEGWSSISLANQKDSVKYFSDNHGFSIIENGSDKTIGRCLIFNIDHINDTATVGIFIGDKKSWGKGYGEDALKLLLDHGFCILNMHNIMLGVFDFNKGAVKCYQKLGFKEIGRKREVRKIYNKRYDAILMDLLASEYTPFYLGDKIKTIVE